MIKVLYAHVDDNGCAQESRLEKKTILLSCFYPDIKFQNIIELFNCFDQKMLSLESWLYA